MSFAAGLRHALHLRQTDVVSELRRGDSLEDILNKHLLAVEEMSDSQILTSVLLLSPDGNHLTHGAAPSLPRPYREVIDGSEIGPSAGSCGTAAYLGRPVYVNDIATDPLWADYKHLALPHGLRSCWSTPIRHADGHVLGTFAIYHRNLSSPTRDELDAIEIITDNVAQAITWARNKDVNEQETEKPDGRTDVEIVPFDLLARQVAALEALTAAMRQQASSLDAEGQEAIEIIVKDSNRLVEVVRRHRAQRN
jgi:GAF domain-containing protein